MRKLCLAALAAIVFLCPDAWAQALVVPNWAVNHSPAVNTQASASQAALAKTRHVATSCSGSIRTVAAQTTIILQLRDGASGAGTVVWSEELGGCAINTQCKITSPFMHIQGSSNTALTCEWSGIPAVGNFAVANLTGYDVGAN